MTPLDSIRRAKHNLSTLLALVLVISATLCIAQQVQDEKSYFEKFGMSFNEKGIEVQSIYVKHREEILKIPGVHDICILAARSALDTGGYLFNVLANPTVDQSTIPNFIEGVPVMVTPQLVTEPTYADEAHKRVAEIKARHELELLYRTEGVVAVGTVREDYRQDGEWVIEIHVKDEAALKGLPKEIEGARVVAKVTGEVRPLSAPDVTIPSLPCAHCGPRLP